jgi:hypothetical protein
MDAPDLDALVRLVAGGDVAVLTGAGLSTDSGRSSGTKRKRRSARVLLPPHGLERPQPPPDEDPFAADCHQLRVTTESRQTSF